MKLKTIAILLIIIFSLIPVYLLYKYLEKVMQAGTSMRRFLFWLVIILVLIFAYTFLVVLVIQMLFPGA